MKRIIVSTSCRELVFQADGISAGQHRLTTSHTIDLGLGQVLGHSKAGAREGEHLLPHLPSLAVEDFNGRDRSAWHGSADHGDLVTNVGHPMAGSATKDILPNGKGSSHSFILSSSSPRGAH